MNERMKKVTVNIPAHDFVQIHLELISRNHLQCFVSLISFPDMLRSSSESREINATHADPGSGSVKRLKKQVNAIVRKGKYPSFILLRFLAGLL